MSAYIYAPFFYGLFAASLLMFGLWLRQCQTRNATSVDIAWATGIGLLALYFAASNTGDPARRLIVAVLAAGWAFRLAWHLHKRAHGEDEDGRYQMLRGQWGASAQRNFFFFYQAQALLVALFALPTFLATANPMPLNWLDALGIFLWLVALVGESMADTQLAQFRRDPANQGRTCRYGLWGYSRHPNYFFEWLHWFTYVPLALPFAFGWLSLFAPVLMLYLLFAVTGIPYTEMRALVSRGDDYRDYQRRTSAFFPWFNKEATQEVTL
ncbi:MAG: steroid 5-alpha reductase family enzyme [Candidatus Latescibacterota bacterium]|jgi:steroid 5-alpha reductase family enzyme